MGYELHHTPVELNTAAIVIGRSSRVLKKLNSYFSIPPFTATFPAWAGGSYIVARIPIQIGKPFAIKLPIVVPSNSFVATIKWNDAETDEVQRYQLWRGVSEVMSWPAYTGQVVGTVCVALEIWCVENSSEAVLPVTWEIEITELSVPDEAQQLKGTEIELPTVCYTHPFSGSLVADYLGRCPCP